jgi:hypothetical protein
MEWFNAGTDEKVESPDLFGCVQLPPPSACFGQSELPYSSKQREFLLNHIRDEKAQSLAWPVVLKACFTTSYTTSVTVTEDSLLGSPMLDSALGQVDAVNKVLAELAGSDASLGKSSKSKNGSSTSASASSTANSKSNSSTSTVSGMKGGQDNSQFDSILPPEMPTSWVQCEACRKWRRVAWSVDSESLPDLWECHMNFWDPESATCAAPQDIYDPDRENTIELTGTVSKDAGGLTVGKWYDVFCLKNRIFYEAQAKKLKPAQKGQKVNTKKPGLTVLVSLGFITECMYIITSYYDWNYLVLATFKKFFHCRFYLVNCLFYNILLLPSSVSLYLLSFTYTEQGSLPLQRLECQVRRMGRGGQRPHSPAQLPH